MSFKLAKFVFDFINLDQSANAFFLSPSFRILATWTMLAATLRPYYGAQARPIHDIVVFQVARQTDVAIRHIHLRIAKFISVRGFH